MNIIVPTVGWIDPGEVFEQALESTMELVRSAIASNALDALLARVYGNYSDEKRAAVGTWLSRNTWTIVQSYPHSEQVFPCWSVVEGSGSNIVQYLGEAVGDGAHGERWQDRIGVITHAEDRNVLKWLHQLSVFGVSRVRREIGEIFRHGQRPQREDLSPMQVQGGRYVWRRALWFVGEYDQRDIDPDEMALTIDPELVARAFRGPDGAQV